MSLVLALDASGAHLSVALWRDGTVLFADAHADFRVRPEPREVLDVLLP